MGIPSEILDPNEAQKIFPLLDPSIFKMALYSPLDGTIDPAMACSALAKVATKNGGKVNSIMVPTDSLIRLFLLIVPKMRHRTCIIFKNN